MFPEIPVELGTLSDAELAALRDEIQAFIAASYDPATFATLPAADADALLADMNRAAAGTEAIDAETSGRATASAQRTADATAALARINPPAPEPEPTLAAEPAPVAPPVPEPTAVTAAAPAPSAPITARSRPTGPVATPPLSAIATMASSPPAAASLAIRPRTSITAGADIPNVRAGEPLDGLTDVAAALLSRSDAFRGGSQSGTEFVTVASLHSNMPVERQLLGGSEAANMEMIAQFTGPTAIMAAGGLCAPVQPYYDIMVLAEADRPVRDAMAVFDGSRGGIRLIPPPSFSAVQGSARVVTDGVTTNGSNVVTSATANFNASFDVGASISGTGIPAATIITAVQPGGTGVVLSANATATATGITFTITRAGSVVVITEAVDAAMLNGTAAQIAAGTKPCLHVSCPGVIEARVNAIPACLEFGNLTARAYPEQVAAWLKLVMAWQARVADSQLLTTISAGSIQVTAAAVLGTARDVIPVAIKAGAYIRNHNRMNPEARLRLLAPAWLIDSAACDLMFGSGYEMEFYSQARQQFLAAWGAANYNTTWYWDSATGAAQLINGGAVQPGGALVAFPTTCVLYIFPEASWVLVDGGKMDLGVVRDNASNSLNNYRLFSEGWETAVNVGVESLAITCTIATNGAYAPAGSAPAGF